MAANAICTHCETIHDEDDQVECIYCGRAVPCVPVPAGDDDAAWAEIATHHDAACEWVETRAHRIEEER